MKSASLKRLIDNHRNMSEKSELNSKIIKATKWSSVTEIAAKLVAPISTMVLARVLTPEAFGVLVTVTMVISFAEIFTDAGFQKYIVQHEFSSKEDLHRSTNVAFWSNLIMSLIIWGFILIFSDQIAELVGNKGYGHVIAISCCCIPLAAFSSIQMALYRRHFDFKTLFIVRIIGVAIPIVITIPLAFIMRSYWALIIGMIGLNLSNAIILTVKSSWKPKLDYSFRLFKEMFSFTSWSMLEAVTIWLTSYIDIFIVGRLLNEYYLGIYRTSMTTVAQFTGLITAATTPVLFSSLSRLQNNREEFMKVFLRFQKAVGLLVIPLGVGLFIFRDAVVDIMLGSQWHEASYFMGIWALTSAITIVLSHYSSEIYRSIGKPKLSVWVQLSHIAVLIPAVWFAVGYGFDFLCTIRALVRLELVIANLITLLLFVRVNPLKMCSNICPELFASMIMALSVTLLPQSTSLIITMAYIVLAIAVYIGIIMCFPQERYIMSNLKKFIRR